MHPIQSVGIGIRISRLQDILVIRLKWPRDTTINPLLPRPGRRRVATFRATAAPGQLLGPRPCGPP